MPEQFPSSEQGPITEEEVIEVLHTKGHQNLEAQKLLQRWLEQEEMGVAKINTGKAAVELIVKTALLYEKAGYKEIALENLEDARVAAHQEHANELYKNIMEIISRIENEIK